jgi:hypothetical protein
MKTVFAALVLGGLTLATAAPAAPPATMGGATDVLTGPTIPNGHAYRKQIALRDLSQEGRALRAADGGKLTPEHLAYLQQKLNDIRAGNY